MVSVVSITAYEEYCNSLLSAVTTLKQYCKVDQATFFSREKSHSPQESIGIVFGLEIVGCDSL